MSAYYEANREANRPTGPLERVFCTSCGEEFTQPRRKAHPFMRCEKCRAHKGDQP